MFKPNQTSTSSASFEKTDVNHLGHIDFWMMFEVIKQRCPRERSVRSGNTYMGFFWKFRNNIFWGLVWWICWSQLAATQYNVVTAEAGVVELAESFMQRKDQQSWAHEEGLWLLFFHSLQSCFLIEVSSGSILSERVSRFHKPHPFLRGVTFSNI